MKVSCRLARLFVFTVPILSLSGPASLAQTGLTNPGFDSARIPPVMDHPGLLPFTELFPGWTGYLGTDALSQTYLNELTGGTASIALIQSNVFSERVALQLSGNSTAVLQTGLYGINSFAGAAIAQTTTVPTGSLSLQFSAWGDTSALTVSFDGQSLGFSPLLAVPILNTVYYVYAADISQFVGQTGELRFTENPTEADPFALVSLDSILFSQTPAPEPGICAFLFIGAILLTAYAVRGQNTSPAPVPHYGRRTCHSPR